MKWVLIYILIPTLGDAEMVEPFLSEGHSVGKTIKIYILFNGHDGPLVNRKIIGLILNSKGVKCAFD